MAFLEQAPGGEITLPSKTLIAALSDGSNQDYWTKICNLAYAIGVPEGRLLNGKIRVTVNGSGDLTLALKTLAGNDPSADDPAFITINGVTRRITSAINIVLAAGTNWFDLGAAEFATIEQDLFAYLVWDSVDSAIRITCSRIPYGRVVSDFNSTSTNEKHLANYANFAASDDVVNIGRFAATLSAGAAYTWSVPTYNNSNLVQEPIFDTRWLNYTPQFSGNNSMTFTSLIITAATYKVALDSVSVAVQATGTTGGVASNQLQATPPFAPPLFSWPMTAAYNDGTSQSQVGLGVAQNTTGLLVVRKQDNSNFGLGTGRLFHMNGAYRIM
jgi:hypothetical protein